MRRRQFDRFMERWEQESREWREEMRALRLDHKRRFDALDAAIANETRLTRELVVEMREGREMMRDMRHGIQATTEGLLRVLDEFRRNDGPSTAGA